MDVVVPCMHERKQFGQPIGDFQLMRASSPTCIRLGRPRAYVYAVGRACDRAGAAAAAILYSAEKATWMAGEAIQALGGVHQRVSDRPSLAQCKTLRDRRGHLGGAAMLSGCELVAEMA
ncbi:acyl-CoA dehydrogenase family protein [Bradyrhizobium retamae]|uniref:acyl-CoA dehydrogenase family protein n=1 Tax=Bradyrhizobium retamae TaxID=1300035 RepID=UPI000B00483E